MKIPIDVIAIDLDAAAGSELPAEVRLRTTVDGARRLARFAAAGAVRLVVIKCRSSKPCKAPKTGETA